MIPSSGSRRHSEYSVWTADIGCTGVRPAEGGGRDLAQSEEPHLSLSYQLRHGTNGFFYGGVDVHTMLVVKIDSLDAQPPEASLACPPDELRPSTHPGELAPLVKDVAKFGRDDGLLAASSEGAADELLVASGSVDVRGIHERYAEVERTPDHLLTSTSSSGP
jgi:hypothetical protein